ncbi:hypothetical protein ACOSP7_020306 [Xanthoceras sorbifolium]
MSKHFLFALLCTFVVAVFVHCQDQTGFISLDCGLPEDSTYEDVNTGINYISDAAFINTGDSKTISAEFPTGDFEKQLWYVRSFPQNIRNCYNIKVKTGTKYLIRARFMYGNYNSQNKKASSVLNFEIIHVSALDYIHICLVNTNLGTPFISALELRPLRNSIYITQSGSLMLLSRLDIGSTTNQTVRYRDDIYDRIWLPYLTLTQLSTNSIIASSDDYHPPESVMSTASTSQNSSGPFYVYFETFDPISEFYIYMYFTETEKLQANQSREFNIYLNDEMWFGPVSPIYLNTTTVYSVAPSGKGLNYFWINKTENSTLPPIINAVEAYTVKEFLQSPTNQSDVDTITKIKSTYGVNKHWQGDPCAPQAYSWDGLKCSYNGYNPPRIVSLNLSSSGLTGNIATDLVNLTSIQNLDLSHNSLTGPVPGFLAKLPSLSVLNLTGNNLTGSVPDELVQRLEDGSLLISCDGNPNLHCHEKKKNKISVPLIASAAALLAILIALAILWRLKRRKVQAFRDERNDLLELKSRSFTYSDIVRITNNFKQVLGKGGFGTVYHGCLGDTQVAVKILSSSSTQGYKEFKAEIILLVRVHHRNLTNFVGYCNEGAEKGLIFEYMANGNLQQHLSARNASKLSWEGRLRIAVDAAQGEDENVHITHCVIDMLGNGDITNIVDPSLEGEFETNSAWKAVELALACAFHVSSKRPTMNDVVMELKECLAMEIVRKKNGHVSEANGSREIFTMNNMDTEIFTTPLAR